MNIVHALFESWNLFWLTRKAKKSAQLSFQQLTEFYELIRNKSISDNGANAIDGAGEIRVARPAPLSDSFNQPTN
jgi:hypothetical protein